MTAPTPKGTDMIFGRVKAARRHSGDRREEIAPPLAGRVPADPVRHRLHHRHRHFRADRRRRAEGRPGPDAGLRHRRRGLHRRRALLCRNRRDGPGRGLRLHLQLRDDGRVPRLDGRLGADPRICDRRLRGVGRLVGLFHRHDPQGNVRHSPATPISPPGRSRSAARRAGSSTCRRWSSPCWSPGC